MTPAETKTLIEYAIYGLIGLGMLILTVAKLMQKLGLIESKKEPEQKPDCLTGSALWNEHLPKFKEAHDEICGGRLATINQTLSDVKQKVDQVPEMKGQVETILRILRRNGGRED